MSADLNLGSIIGRATRDAETKVSNGGLTVCKFSIAVNGYKENDTSFFDCVMFGKFAEGVGKYIIKGKRLALNYKLKQNKWQDNEGHNRYSVDLIINNLQLLDGGNSNKQTEQMFNTKDSGSFEEDLAF